MKTSILLICLALSFAANAQQKSTTAVVKDNILKDYHAPDFTYYAKNYEELFGRYRYTFDVLNTGTRSIFVAPDGNFYSLGDGRQIPFMTMAGNTMLYYNYNGANILSGALSAIAGERITAGYTFRKKK